MIRLKGLKGISRWLDDLHRKYGYKNTEETIEALGFSEYGEEAKIIKIWRGKLY
ncbi:hypothetical protein KYTH92_12050 [Helicobacter pylori]|nr:hypothetical protein [Helicobacter pylori]